MRAEITDEEARYFLDNGYLILRDVLLGEELSRVQAAMMELVREGSERVVDDPDFAYGEGHKTGAKILRRIEYVIDKRDEMKVLLANPFILRSVEKLMSSDLIPTWDSMVLKQPGEGIIVPWHRDAGTDQVCDKPIFNVDFYLDEADEDTCVWLIPGSHQWSSQAAQAEITRRNTPFESQDAIPALMHPGDVLFHNILALHGSPANTSHKLRRVVYYEFRSAHVEAEIGPHVPEYIPLKQRMLMRCIERRKLADYVPADEIPFEYAPPAPFEMKLPQRDEESPEFRYPHGEFWRA